jgi:sulfur-carrier protein
MRLRYFASIREKLGVGEEEIQPPADVSTLAQLLDWLKSRGENYADAFEREAMVRCAIDQMHAQSGAAIAGAREIAFFPPMTGG